MVNPSYIQITPCSALAEGNEFSSQLYLYQTASGPNPTQSVIISRPVGLGNMAVNNWLVRDGLGPNAKVVARAQGLHLYAGDYYCSFSLVFEEERFKGSTLQVMGIPLGEGDWAIVGGTGQFAMATGVINQKVHSNNVGVERVIKLTIQGFCPLLKGSRPVQCLATKIGPWGGNGGSAQDITEPPKRLESVTIYSGELIDSIAFSYVDQAGQKRTAGPWGGSGGAPHTVQLASSEFVKEVSGTFGVSNGAKVICSIKLVTNVNTYGPFGNSERGTPFSVPVQGNSGIVGFFARAGEFVDAIGVYAHPL